LRIIHGLQEALAAGLEKPVCTVGFFDGVHRGHSLVLEDLRNWAQEIEGTPTVITFDRHPKGIIGAGDPIPITPLEERLERLAGERVEVTILLPFDEELSRWSPERFIEEALVGAVGCRHLLMGFDSAFGAGARGTAEYLKSLPSLAVELRESRPVEVDGEPVSSTAIRKAVISGELDRAASLLGRPYGLRAPVISGERRGQMIGFPTANLDPGFVLVPPVGVYLGLARRQGKIWPAAINIGRRPTFGGEEAAEGTPFDPRLDRFEAHLVGFDGDLYGVILEVEMHRFLRGEKRFDGVKELCQQIKLDLEDLDRWWRSREG